MKTMNELKERISEIDKAYSRLMKERQDLVAEGNQESSNRIAKIDAEIILIRNEKGNCIEAGQSISLKF